MEKTCSKCGKTKPLEDFYRDKGMPDGRRGDCKVCNCRKARKYYHENKDDIRVYRRKYYKEHKEEILKYQLHYARANKDKIEAYRRNYRSRKHQNKTYKVTDKDCLTIKNRPCMMCGSRKDIQLDHVIPVSRNGNHSIGNLQPLCKPCNTSKANKYMIEWKRHKQTYV